MKKTKAYFITGTGTGVGKTFVTAGLALLFHHKGLKTAVMKPIQTGARKDADDLSFVRRLVPDVSFIPSVYSFHFPASPHLAAKFAKKKINPEQIIKSVNKIKNSGLYDVLLIEGVGGLMTPLNENYMLIDLLKKLRVPVILVTLNELGSINHTLLSIEALRRRKINNSGIIFNMHPRNPEAIHKDNIKTIQEIGKVPALAVIKELSGLRALREVSRLSGKNLLRTQKEILAQFKSQITFLKALIPSRNHF